MGWIFVALTGLFTLSAITQLASGRLFSGGSATRLSQLARLVDQAQAHRPPIAQVADRIGRRFVAGLLLCAVAVYVFWHFHQPER